ncbi:MAG: hypothetical protein JNJ88_06800 [Planctomycetes bacterium]|nr:hypothetical protein [Planctomycetota bacterium]
MVRSRVKSLALWVTPSVVAALSLGRPALAQSFPAFADLNQDGSPDLA